MIIKLIYYIYKILYEKYIKNIIKYIIKHIIKNNKKNKNILKIYNIFIYNLYIKI
jgi:hypothetical protein